MTNFHVNHGVSGLRERGANIMFDDKMSGLREGSANVMFEEDLSGLRESAANIDLGGLREESAGIELDGLRESAADIELDGLRESAADIKLDGLRESAADIELGGLALDMAGLREESAAISLELEGVHSTIANAHSPRGVVSMHGLREQAADIVLEGLRESAANLEFEMEGLREEAAAIELDAEAEMSGNSEMGRRGKGKRRANRQARRRRSGFPRRFTRAFARARRLAPPPTRRKATRFFRGGSISSPGRIDRGGRINGIGNMGSIFDFLALGDQIPKEEYANRTAAARTRFDKLQEAIQELPEQQRTAVLVKMQQIGANEAELLGLEKVVRQGNRIIPRRVRNLTKFEVGLSVLEKLAGAVADTDPAVDAQGDPDPQEEKERTDEATINIIDGEQKKAKMPNILTTVAIGTVGLGVIYGAVRLATK